MRNKIYLIIFIILIVGVIGFFIWQGAKNNQASPALDSFAKCLTEKGAVMYGTESCSWCQKEKANFKDAWRFISYIDCSKNPKDCLALGVEMTPTWIFPDGKRLTGYQGLEKLAKESGCPL